MLDGEQTHLVLYMPDTSFPDTGRTRRRCAHCSGPGRPDEKGGTAERPEEGASNSEDPFEAFAKPLARY